MPMLLIHSVGHKSGQPRTTPLLYMAEGDDLVIVASFYGSPGDPAWYRNLQAKPECEVRVGRRRFPAHARTADAAERARLWPKLVAAYSGYADYQARTDREIPVVVLTPASPAPTAA
jgi:deazaflavin-dependent oxidoreductase (nitroreductase family)